MGLDFFLDINMFILVWVLLIWYGFCCFLVLSWVLIGFFSGRFFFFFFLVETIVDFIYKIILYNGKEKRRAFF